MPESLDASRLSGFLGLKLQHIHRCPFHAQRRLGVQTLICYGLLACLKGLKEQGCNGPVTEAMDRMEQHLNQAAHDEENA